jgi:hypothetical protein
MIESLFSTNCPSKDVSGRILERRVSDFREIAFGLWLGVRHLPGFSAGNSSPVVRTRIGKAIHRTVNGFHGST